MTSHPTRHHLRDSWDDFRLGKVSRREFVARAAAMGLASPVILAAINASGSHGASAQEIASERPSIGTDGQLRGTGGELKVRQWFAAHHAFAHHPGFSFSSADVSSLINEPLLSYAPDGSLLANLVTEVPTKTNGGLSEDLARVTLNLREGVLWSDGEPFTAEDVVWTWQWITDESNASVNRSAWSPIQSVEAISPTRVELIYAETMLAWFVWFVPIAGAYFGSIIPRHAWSGKDKDAVNAEFAINPIGTGPYKVESFVPGDYAVCAINEQYREPNKPFFATVRFQGGGDASTAAQAVLQEGDWDAAAGLEMEQSVLLELESEGGKGKVVGGLPIDVERIMFNFSDPNQVIDGERSSLQAPHPFLTDRAVRLAMALAIDREAIAKVFANPDLIPVARNILTGIPALESPNTSYEFNIDAANDLLDDAGWVREGDVRIRNGIELKVTYHTLVTGSSSQPMTFRPQIQNIVKKGWEAIGIKVELGQIDGDVFFGTSPDNDLSYTHFYQDVQMYALGPDFPVPNTFGEFYAGPNNSNVAQKANDWTGGNTQRYVNPEFDLLYEEVSSTTDQERAAELFIQMNDLVVGDVVAVPLTARPRSLCAVSNRLAAENVATSTWEPFFWNIANWRTVD